jgi:hypothetical protein
MDQNQENESSWVKLFSIRVYLLLYFKSIFKKI